MAANAARAIWAAIQDVAAEVRQRRHLRSAIAELQGLDDRTLQDMGVRRDNIKSLVHSNLGRRGS